MPIRTPVILSLAALLLLIVSPVIHRELARSPTSNEEEVVANDFPVDGFSAAQAIESTTPEEAGEPDQQEASSSEETTHPEIEESTEASFAIETTADQSEIHDAPSEAVEVAPALSDGPEEPADPDAVREMVEPVARELVAELIANVGGTPVALVQNPLLPGNLVVLDQTGAILLFDLGSVAWRPMHDMRKLVRADGEAGLHSIAFHPADPRRAFVLYNDNELALALDELHLDAEARTLEFDSHRLRIPPAYGAHNGGALAFGPDGLLYVSVGDGGEQDDPDGRAQDLASWHGKILRIDVDAPGPGYAVPHDNPFASGPRPEVWLYGFRNPWRMSFDAQTGDLWIADVGGSIAEEINVHRADAAPGANYGWRIFEGQARRWSGEPGHVVFPLHEYRPTSGRCAIVGGFVHPEAGHALDGSYLYSDFCDGRLRALTLDDAGSWSTREVLKLGPLVVSLAPLEDGTIAVLGYRGEVWRVAYA